MVVAYLRVALCQILTAKHGYLPLKACFKKLVSHETPVKKPVFDLPAGFFVQLKLWV
jgi:hypothetical protein